MTQKYFDNLPLIYYNNKLVRDITRRVKLIDDTRNIPHVFYPYDVEHELRSDTIAEYYYGDSQLDWLLYAANGVVDPYYGWYLNENQLQKLMIEKYGSLENAIKKIKVYRNNWATDDTEISVSYYENTLAQILKKYYSPLWSQVGTKIMGYKRKQEDVTTNTNRIIDFNISANNNSISLANGELIDIKAAGGSSATIGTGEIITANSTIVRIHNVSGETTANTANLKLIVGEQTQGNVTVNNSVIVKENITLVEQAYWSPVSFYQYEQEQNELRKNLLVVGIEVKDLVVEQFQRLIQQDMDPVTRIVETN